MGLGVSFLVTDPQTRELVKVSANVFLAVKICSLMRSLRCANSSVLTSLY